MEQSNEAVATEEASVPVAETTSNNNDDLGGISPDLLASLGIETESNSQPEEEQQEFEEESNSELDPAGQNDDGDNAEAPSDNFKIVHDGVERNLSLDELRSYAQKGFDYTNKTMTLAEQRKEWETQVETEKNNNIKQVEALQSRQKELEDVTQLKGQWDYYLDAQSKTNPDLFEEIQSGFQETVKQFDNPFVSAEMAAIKEKMAGYETEMQSRQNAQISGEFNKGLLESKEKWSKDFEALGLKMDDEKIKEAYVNGAETVDDAIINTYGKDMIKLMKSKSKVEGTANRAKAAKTVPTAGTQRNAKPKKDMAASGTRKNGRLRGYGDILSQVVRENLS